MTSLIGEIVEIISDEMVLINLGSEAGVQEGMIFVIYNEGPHVYDGTFNDLGSLDIVKGRVRVRHVMPKMSEAATLTEIVEVGGISFWLGGIGTRKEARPLKLEVEKANESLAQALKDRVVRIGDKVRYVSGPKE